jgi:dihydroneopterin aldolase
MSDLIKIVGVKAKGFHGVLESERVRGQKFIVDVELRLNLSKLNDDLNKTVNYAQVAMVINDQITGKPQKLIETLAENIAVKILKDFKKVKSVKVIVHKPKAPIALNFKDIQVEIERSR